MLVPYGWTVVQTPLSHRMNEYCNGGTPPVAVAVHVMDVTPFAVNGNVRFAARLVTVGSAPPRMTKPGPNSETSATAVEPALRTST